MQENWFSKERILNRIITKQEIEKIYEGLTSPCQSIKLIVSLENSTKPLKNTLFQCYWKLFLSRKKKFPNSFCEVSITFIPKPN